MKKQITITMIMTLSIIPKTSLSMYFGWGWSSVLPQNSLPKEKKSPLSSDDDCCFPEQKNKKEH